MSEPTPSDAPYRDPSRPIADRVEDLLARMTVEEKVAQLGGVWSTALVVDDAFSTSRAEHLLVHGTGHITRIAASTGLRPAGLAALADQIQTHLVEHTRLGIPAVIHEEAVAGFCARDATQFPQAIGLAATWDPELMAEVATVIRDQMLAVGARHTLSPVLDIGRDPRWGRVEETYGEDPELAGQMGVAYVRALQGGRGPDDLAGGVVCTGKHFVGYSLPDGGLNHGPVQLGPRELREVFAEPFAAAIRDAGLASVMNSYSSVDGIACAASAAILTDLLREELGFEGPVVADYFSVDLIRTHHRVAADKAGAARAALTAGLDVELPALDCYATLGASLDEGSIEIEVIDRAVRRVLHQKFALGLFEHPLAPAGSIAESYGRPEHRALARRAAAAACVIVENDGVLPLPAGLSRIAVIGPAADDVRLTQGDYHYPAHAEIVYASGAVDLLPGAGGAFAAGPYFPDTVTPLDAVRAAYPTASIDVTPGCDLVGDDRAGIAAAAAAAAAAEIALVFVGGRSGLMPDSTVGEARDAADLRMTGLQRELVGAVAATGTPTVVVVMSGRVHALEEEAAAANALVIAWPGGEEAGAGIMDVLTGAVEPSGCLPVSLPRRTGQVPVHHNHRAGGGSSKFWGDYADGPAAPLHRFGHGLHYSTVAYGPLTAIGTTTSEVVEVTVPVENTGARGCIETVQLYGRDDVASVARPDRQLLGFARVPLAAGERRTATFTVHPSKLAGFDPSMRRVCEPGSFTFASGPTSNRLEQQAQVVLDGPVAPYAQCAVTPTCVTLDGA